MPTKNLAELRKKYDDLAARTSRFDLETRELEKKQRDDQKALTDRRRAEKKALMDEKRAASLAIEEAEAIPAEDAPSPTPPANEAPQTHAAPAKHPPGRRTGASADRAFEDKDK